VSGADRTTASWLSGHGVDEVREWKCHPQPTPYRVVCPACGLRARGLWCDERHVECRCAVCRAKFKAKDNIERGKHDAS
jgi:hypothetical protein